MFNKLELMGTACRPSESPLRFAYLSIHMLPRFFGKPGCAQDLFKTIIKALKRFSTLLCHIGQAFVLIYMMSTTYKFL